MSAAADTRERLLEPVDRISEILFGLIMVLTFTGAISINTDPSDETALLVAAIGCNLAWGIVDGVMFLTMGLIERARGLRLLRALRANEPERGNALIAANLPPALVATMDQDELDVLRRNLLEIEAPPTPRVRREDWLGALAVAGLVFLSTFPPVVPFLVVDDQRTAIRLSNAVAVAMMFACGHALGRYAGMNPRRVGLAMAVLGMVLVTVTIALGG